jgi:methyl-accepting chemotaxis protein
MPSGRGQSTFLWLSLPVPAQGWLEPALFLGAVSNVVEVYGEGQRLYASGTLDASGREVTENMGWHLVPLPPSVLGKRVLLRIQSSAPSIGVRQAAQVGARHELLAAASRAGQAPFSLGVLLLAIALISAVAISLVKQRWMLVALTLFSASSGLLLLGTSGLIMALWDAPVASTLLTQVGMYFILPSLAWFISEALLERRVRWFSRLVVGQGVIGALLCVAAVVDFGSAQRTMPVFILYALVGFLLTAALSAAEAWKGNRDARIFACGMGAYLVSIFISILPLFGVLEGLGNVIHWGFLALALSLVGVVVRRSAQVVSTLEAHTRQVEAQQHSVQHLAERMGSGAAELATVVQQLRASSEEQSAGVSQQAVALHQAGQTVGEIRRSSQLTAEKATLLATSATRAEQVGREGSEAIERTLSNLEAIRGEVSEMARRILALDARTREVSGIVDTVKTLADQSNLLAVNAAIEAVRSGEHGKGFGVVAREVRNLADQSIQATLRIREVLDSVSENMREAAKVSEQGEERVRLSLDAVRVYGEQMQQMAGIIGDTSTSVRQITAAVTQQDAGTSQMAITIQELSAQMQRTLKAVKETQSVSQSVQALAESMSGVALQVLQADARPHAQ